MVAFESKRQSPRQRRSHATVGAILEAAAQVLEAEGEGGFNTNAVAQRAGVSIGSLYRYFPDKRAILVELARRETEANNAFTARVLGGGDVGSLAPDRAAIRAFLHAFAGRRVARRAAVRALLASADPAELAAGFATSVRELRGPDGQPVPAIKAFVLTRAINGAMRAAVLEDADFLHDRQFEDELVRLSRAYLRSAD